MTVSVGCSPTAAYIQGAVEIRAQRYFTVKNSEIFNIDTSFMHEHASWYSTSRLMCSLSSMQHLRNFIETSRDLYSRPTPPFSEESLPSLKGSVYIVTGASSGIGVEIARILVSCGAKVYIYGNTPSRISATLAKIRAEYPKCKIEGIQVSFDDLKTVKPAAEKFLAKEKRLDGIIHNAGMNWPGIDRYTEYGFLDVFVANVLGPHLLQKFLDNILEETAKKSAAGSVRVIWVASSSHYFAPEGGVDLENINGATNGALGFGIYGQTKALNIYQAYQWSHHHEDTKVVSVSVHPGMIISDIRRNKPDRKFILHLLCRETVQGAYAVLCPLFTPLDSRDNGKYFVPMGQEGVVRGDVWKAVRSPYGQKVWHWLDEQVAPYA